MRYGPETVDIAARLLNTAMAEVIPEGTRPPYYLRFVDPGLARGTGHQIDMTWDRPG